MDACICMAEPLCYSPETTTTLLMGYTHLKFGGGGRKELEERAKRSGASKCYIEDFTKVISVIQVSTALTHCFYFYSILHLL